MDEIIANLCARLGVSADEAREIAEADRRTDRGEKLFELTPEQQKASKSARIVPRASAAYCRTGRNFNYTTSSEKSQ